MSDGKTRGDGEPPSPQCPIRVADYSSVTRLALQPNPSPGDYREAMAIANTEAKARLGEAMLLSWYDRDRDFEAPQHASECHEDSAVPGYVDYGINHGARLEISLEGGRFVFFYLPLDPEVGQ
jgi:hypothetical protein